MKLWRDLRKKALIFHRGGNALETQVIWADWAISAAQLQSTVGCPESDDPQLSVDDHQITVSR
jgi:hypothetical protein